MGYVYTPQITDLLSGCACAIIFILLLSLDAWRAKQRKAYWFPAGFLALNALTLQFIYYVDYSTVNVTSGTEDITGEDVENFLKIQLVIDSGRLLICVFIAYLLPGLVSSRFRSVWGDIGALALNVLFHMLHEIYLIDYIYVHFSDYEETWFTVFSVMVFIVIILLVLLSICVVLAGKSIRIIIKKKVRWELSCCSSSRTDRGNISDHVLKCCSTSHTDRGNIRDHVLKCCGNIRDHVLKCCSSSHTDSGNIRDHVLKCCSSSRTDSGNIMDHVLKCWIVVRSSQPEYIMARSVVSSFAGLLVTVCVILMAVKWSCIYKDDYKKLNPLNKATLCLQFSFALFGWIVVSVRWLTAVRYFPRVGQNLFQVEDFWKRSLIELKYGRLKSPLFRERRNRNRTLLESFIMDLIIAVHLDNLVLFIGLLLQILTVLLSKAFFFLSWVLFWPLVMDREKIRSLSGSEISTSEFSNCKEVLESIAMPGEMAESLWIANESAFKLTKKHMKRGKNRSQHLIAIMKSLQTEATVADKGEEEKYLNYAGKRCWKLRAVSLIHFMLCSYDDTNYKVVDYAFQACSEAWPLMDFVESSHTEANLASLAADKEFDALQNIWNKDLKKKSTQSERVRTIQKRMIEDIKSRIFDGESQVSVENMQDSMDDMTVVANFSLNKTSKAIDLYSAHAINKLRCLLADVIIDCLKNEVENALIEKCNEWAVLGEETEIYHAAFIAGKAIPAIPALDWYAKSSQGNNESEGDVNNASQGEAVAGGKEEVLSGFAEAADFIHEKGQEIEDGGGSVGDDIC